MHSHDESEAAALLAGLELPDEAGALLVEPRYWREDVAHVLFERVDELVFADPEAGHRLARLVPDFVRRVESPGLVSLKTRAVAVLGSSWRALGDLESAQTYLRGARLLAIYGSRSAFVDVARRRAAVFMEQGRHHDALMRADEALHFSRGAEEIGRAYLSRGLVHLHFLGFDDAVQDFTKAVGLLEPNPSSIYYFCALLNRGWAFAHGASGTEQLNLARKDIEAIRAFCKHGGSSFAGVRLRWLHGIIAARLGELDCAAAELSSVRNDIQWLGLAREYAVVTLDLAEVYYRQGRHRDLSSLAAELFPVLGALKGHPDAYAAVMLFRNAALEGQVTVEVVREAKARLRKGLVPSASP